jgi:hypothetical protein
MAASSHDFQFIFTTYFIPNPSLFTTERVINSLEKRWLYIWPANTSRTEEKKLFYVSYDYHNKQQPFYWTVLAKRFS